MNNKDFIKAYIRDESPLFSCLTHKHEIVNERQINSAVCDITKVHEIPYTER